MVVADPVGESVRKFRQARHLTQQQLADLVGVARTTVIAWESSKSSPSAADLPLIAEALGISQAQLLSIEQSQPRPESPLNVVSRHEEPFSGRLVRLPIYRWGSLGDPRTNESMPSPDREEFPPRGRESLIGPLGFGVDVRGESMIGRDIRDGDVCWINPDRTYRYGSVVLALVANCDGESGMVVKTYGQSETGDCLIAEPRDGKYVLACREFTIIGPVVWIERGFPPR